MTKKKIAHTKKSTKRPAKRREEQPLPAGVLERAAARAGIELAPPSSLICNDKVLDGGEGFDPAATVGDLIRLLFEAPNRQGQGLLTDVLLCTADEAAMLSYCQNNDDGMLGDVMARVTLRMEWRAKIAIELDKRMRAAELAAGGAS